MPKVKTEKTMFGGKEFTMVVNCNSSGEFTINLPKESHQFLGVKRVTGKTMEEAIKKFKAARKKLGESLVEVERAIRYEVQIKFEDRSDFSFARGICVGLQVENGYRSTTKDTNGKVIHTKFSNDHPQVNYWEETDCKTCPDCNGCISVCGCDNDRQIQGCSDCGRPVQHAPQPYPDGFFNNSFSSDKKVMSWTPEREAFFMKLCTGMIEIARGLKIIDEDDEVRDKLVEMGSIRLADLPDELFRRALPAPKGD